MAALLGLTKTGDDDDPNAKVVRLLPEVAEVLRERREEMVAAQHPGLTEGRVFRPGIERVRARIGPSMTFFPDLSPYRYSKLEGWRLDLNVGWLSRDHEFTRGPAPAGFVEALLMCAMRPIRVWRGLHECDLCPGAITRMDLGGRLVHLGNGEIRVTGSDGRMYAAPTLVAHYVDHHEYLPPAAFIDGVMALADTL